MLTKQEIFDKVKTHLLTQKVKSRQDSKLPGTTGILCLYRGPNDTKCAVGCLITDEAYETATKDYGDFNSEGLHNVAVLHALELSGVLDPDVDSILIDMLEDLQKIHDIRETEEWEEELRDYASAHGLVW